MSSKKVHLVIFELYTEEESIITLCRLFTLSHFKISLCVSEHIWTLINSHVDPNDISDSIIFDPKDSIEDIYFNLLNFCEKSSVNLVLMPGFNPISIKEGLLTKKLAENVPLCMGVYNYSKWFSVIPKNIFNGWKLLRRSSIISWICCKIVLHKINYFFVSEPHRYSSNPLKKILSEKTGKPVFDFPFKVTRKDYIPNFDYKMPIFCIPGVIEKHRRNYLSVLDFFSSDELRSQNWQLILLGRPKADYGKKIITYAQNINDKSDEKRIIYFRDWVDRDEYDYQINRSTHILAPLSIKNYSFGKDSGAIYDILKYNKIGILPENYFYDDDLLEKKALITYNNFNELYNILTRIISGSYPYHILKENSHQIRDYFREEHYAAYLENEFKSYLL